jgi:hypothetical protein
VSRSRQRWAEPSRGDAGKRRALQRVVVTARGAGGGAAAAMRWRPWGLMSARVGRGGALMTHLPGSPRRRPSWAIRGAAGSRMVCMCQGDGGGAEDFAAGGRRTRRARSAGWGTAPGAGSGAHFLPRIHASVSPRCVDSTASIRTEQQPGPKESSHEAAEVITCRAAPFGTRATCPRRPRAPGGPAASAAARQLRAGERTHAAV